jgi:hypothetical protein
MFQEPPFRHFSPFLKVLALIMVMIITFLLVLALGVAVSIPFFGRGLLDGLSVMNDYTDPTTIMALKYFQIVNQVGFFILPAFLFVILTDNNIKRYLSLDRGIKRFSLVFSVLLLLVSLPFVSWILDLNSRMHLPELLSGVETWMRNSEEKAEMLNKAFLSTSSWGGFLVNLLMIAVLAAVGEELIFRGILVRLFREWTGNVHMAIIIPALLFSALHLQFYGFFARTIMGIFLGYLFVWTGSLWVPVFVHFLNNGIAVVVSFLNQRGLTQTDLETLGSSNHPAVITLSVALTAFILVMIYMHEKGLMRNWSIKKRLPD